MARHPRSSHMLPKNSSTDYVSSPEHSFLHLRHCLPQDEDGVISPRSNLLSPSVEGRHIKYDLRSPVQRGPLYASCHLCITVPLVPRYICLPPRYVLAPKKIQVQQCQLVLAFIFGYLSHPTLSECPVGVTWMPPSLQALSLLANPVPLCHNRMVER